MAKNKISEWSSTPANNTDVGGIDINEGCAPSGINNAIREVMAQIKDQQAGTDGDNFTVGGNLSVTGTSTLTGAVTATAGISLGTALTVANGGTGATSITANSVILGNGTSALSGNLVAPSTSGNVLTSNGTTWTSAAPVDPVPSGAVMHFAMNSAPTGWLKADGAAISRTTYASLFSAIGTTFGSGDGSTTFNVPDLRGEFTRGWDDGRGVDSGRAFGSSQTQSYTLPLDGSYPTNGTPYNAQGYLASPYEGADAHAVSYKVSGTRTFTTGDTRPRNVALLACIKV